MERREILTRGDATLKVEGIEGTCGYYGSAPSDVGGASVWIAQRFTQLMTTQNPNDYGTGHRVLNAWLQANKEHGALGIAYNAKYYWKVIVRAGPFDYVDKPST